MNNSHTSRVIIITLLFTTIQLYTMQETLQETYQQCCWHCVLPMAVIGCLHACERYCKEPERDKTPTQQTTQPSDPQAKRKPFGGMGTEGNLQTKRQEPSLVELQEGDLPPVRKRSHGSSNLPKLEEEKTTEKNDGDDKEWELV